MNKQFEERLTRLARAEERTECERMGNDKKRIQKRIDWLRRHLEQLEDILAKKYFR